MMKKINKFAFTLIELLAVIIILAIIALIATPIILNVIEEAKISAGKSEANMILSGINNYCATEEVKEEIDENYIKKCTTEMNEDTVKEMVNLGNATIDKIIYNGNKLTELEITSNNHKFRLCPSGTFAMDDEECDKENFPNNKGPIKEVILSNFPYLATNGNGCLTPNDNNYSYMGGCYLKGSKISGKDEFYNTMYAYEMEYDEITETFFDSEGIFKLQEFEPWFRNFVKQQGMTDEQVDQMLEQAGVTTIFELFFGTSSEEFFSRKPLNNSIWYSGFLWRIMGINADGTIKLITDENVTAIPWGDNESVENWSDSYVNDWLNNYFYPRLKGNNIIVEQTWCSETTTDEGSKRSKCTNNLSTEQAKVGLLTLDEYNLVGGKKSRFNYLNIDQSYLTITPQNEDTIWLIRDFDFPGFSSLNHSYGIRPIINVKPDSIINGGNGILEKVWNSEIGPYILNEDKNGEVTEKLNEKSTSGEYVLFAGKKYRIVDKDSNGNTKLILDGYYEETDGKTYKIKFGNNNIFSTDTGIGKKLNTDVLNWLVASDDVINRNKLVTNYTWYQNNFASVDSYKVSLEEINPTRKIEATVGLIRVGEMLSSQSSSILTKNYTNIFFDQVYYWTITPNSEYANNIWAISSEGGSNRWNYSVDNSIRPVIVIKSDINIITGNGTWSNPYQI